MGHDQALGRAVPALGQQMREQCRSQGESQGQDRRAVCPMTGFQLGAGDWNRTRTVRGSAAGSIAESSRI